MLNFFFYLSVFAFQLYSPAELYCLFFWFLLLFLSIMKVLTHHWHNQIPCRTNLTIYIHMLKYFYTRIVKKKKKSNRPVSYWLTRPYIYFFAFPICSCLYTMYISSLIVTLAVVSSVRMSIIKCHMCRFPHHHEWSNHSRFLFFSSAIYFASLSSFVSFWKKNSYFHHVIWIIFFKNNGNSQSKTEYNRNIFLKQPFFLKLHPYQFGKLQTSSSLKSCLTELFVWCMYRDSAIHIERFILFNHSTVFFQQIHIHHVSSQTFQSTRDF